MILHEKDSETWRPSKHKESNALSTYRHSDRCWTLCICSFPICSHKPHTYLSDLHQRYQFRVWISSSNMMHIWTFLFTLNLFVSPDRVVRMPSTRWVLAPSADWQNTHTHTQQKVFISHWAVVLCLLAGVDSSSPGHIWNYRNEEVISSRWMWVDMLLWLCI